MALKNLASEKKIFGLLWRCVYSFRAIAHLWKMAPPEFDAQSKLYLINKLKKDLLQFKAEDVVSFFKEDQKIKDIRKIIIEKEIDYIFISAKAYFSQIKIAERIIELDPNANCLHISLDKKNTEVNGVFSEAIHLNLIEVTKLLPRLRDKKIFTQGWLFRYHILSVIHHNIGENTHCLDVMDVNSFFFPSPVSRKVGRLMKATWGSDALRNQKLQERSEKYLIANAHQILFPGSIYHFKDLMVNKRRLFNAVFPFSGFPLRKYFAQPVMRSIEGDVRLAFAGGIPPFDDRRVPQFFKDAQLISTLEMILSKDGVTVDVFNNPKGYDSRKYKEMYTPHFDLMKRFSGRYRFNRGEVPAEMAVRLSEYDLALMAYDFSGLLIGENHFDYIIPSKFYLYMESCLPVVVSNKLVAVSEEVCKYGLGVVVAQDELPFLADRLRNVDVISLKKNVAAYREMLCNKDAQQYLLTKRGGLGNLNSPLSG